MVEFLQILICGDCDCVVAWGVGWTAGKDKNGAWVVMVVVVVEAVVATEWAPLNSKCLNKINGSIT